MSEQEHGLWLIAYDHGGYGASDFIIEEIKNPTNILGREEQAASKRAAELIQKGYEVHVIQGWKFNIHTEYQRVTGVRIGGGYTEVSYEEKKQE